MYVGAIKCILWYNSQICGPFHNSTVPKFVDLSIIVQSPNLWTFPYSIVPKFVDCFCMAHKYTMWSTMRGITLIHYNFILHFLVD